MVDREFSYLEALSKCSFEKKFWRCQQEVFDLIDDRRLMVVKKPRGAGFTTAAAALMVAGLLNKPGFSGVLICAGYGFCQSAFETIVSLIPKDIVFKVVNNFTLELGDSKVKVIAGYQFVDEQGKYDLAVVDEYAWQKNDPMTGFTIVGSITESILGFLQINSQRVLVGSTPGPTHNKAGDLNKFYSLWVHDNEYTKVNWRRSGHEVLGEVLINWEESDFKMNEVFGEFFEQPKDKWPKKNNDSISLERRGKEFKLSFRSEDGSVFSKALSLDQMHQITIKFNNLILSEKKSIEEIEALMANSSPEIKVTDRYLEKTYDEVKWGNNLGCSEARNFRAKIVNPLEVEENWGK